MRPCSQAWAHNRALPTGLAWPCFPVRSSQKAQWPQGKNSGDHAGNMVGTMAQWAQGKASGSHARNMVGAMAQWAQGKDLGSHARNMVGAMA
eukprot:1158789-Pelagomonas_calceolata.AAC.1